MVFKKREIGEPKSLFKPKNVNTGEIQPDTALSIEKDHTFVGVLEQLSHLFLYTHEMFNELMAEAFTTSDRITSLQKRVNKVKEDVPELQRRLLGTASQQMMITPRLIYQVEPKEDYQFLTKLTRSPATRDVYGCAQPLPKFEILDPYVPKGEHCVVKYSNPNIFVECWMQEMQKAYEDAKRLKEERKKERGKKGRTRKKSVIRKIKKREYAGGEIDFPPTRPMSSISSESFSSSSLSKPSDTPSPSPSSSTPSPSPTPQTHQPVETPTAPQAPIIPQTSTDPQTSSQEEVSVAPPPLPPRPPEETPQSSSIDSSESTNRPTISTHQQTREDPRSRAPAPPPPTRQPATSPSSQTLPPPLTTSSIPSPSSQQTQSPSPSPSPSPTPGTSHSTTTTPPPPPPPPKKSDPSLQGIVRSKATAPPPKKSAPAPQVAPRGALLSSIQQGVTLRKVVDDGGKKKGAKESEMGFNIARILARRAAIETTESDDEEEEEEWGEEEGEE